MQRTWVTKVQTFIIGNKDFVEMCILSRDSHDTWQVSNILNAIMNRTENTDFSWPKSSLETIWCNGVRRGARSSLGRPRRAGRQAARRACGAGAGGGASGVNALCIPFLLLIFDLLHYVIKIWMNQGQGALMFIFLERWKSDSRVFFELVVLASIICWLWVALDNQFYGPKFLQFFYCALKREADHLLI